MGNQGVNGRGTLLLKQLRGPSNRVARVDQIVNENTYPIPDVSHQHHAGITQLTVLGGTTFLEDSVNSAVCEL